MRPRSDNRRGRNVCVSSRITDKEDDLLIGIAEKETTTRSTLVAEAIRDFLRKKIGDNNIIIEVEKDEDGIFVGSVPSIPGCHTQGETIEELIANLKEAIEVNLDL